MKVVGYSDRLSVQPGQTIRFMVSCELPSYRADVVRLIHGDDNPKGPGFEEEAVSTAANGEYPGRAQHIYSGSYVSVPDSPLFECPDGFTIQAWVRATTPQKGVQGVVTRWSGSDGYGLFIDGRRRPDAVGRRRRRQGREGEHGKSDEGARLVFRRRLIRPRDGTGTPPPGASHQLADRRFEGGRRVLHIRGHGVDRTAGSAHGGVSGARRHRTGHPWRILQRKDRRPSSMGQTARLRGDSVAASRHPAWKPRRRVGGGRGTFRPTSHPAG